MLLLLLSTALAAPAPTTVFLARHAEKATGKAPPLTDAGQERAANLARALADAELTAVFTTDLCRTAQTADPVAQAHDLPLRVLPISGTDLSTCSPALSQPVAPLPGDQDGTLVAAIRALPPGSTVFVAGHSNTVPQLVEALGAPSLCPEVLPYDDEERCWLAHSDYDDLFVVTLPKRGPASAVRMHVGPPSP